MKAPYDLLRAKFLDSLLTDKAELERDLAAVNQLVTTCNPRQSSRQNPIVLDERTKIWATDEQSGCWYVRRDNWEGRRWPAELNALLKEWGFLP